jgi:hypothetical protein
VSFLGEFSFLCQRSFVIQSRNMRRYYLFAISILFFAIVSFNVDAGSYTLLNGEVLSGDPVSFNETGLIVKKSDGSFSARTPWEKFSQDSLKFLKGEAQTPKEKDFIDPFIEDSAQNETKRREIVIKEVAKPTRPTGNVGLSASFSSPIFILIFFILYLANLYAAYEIAFFKNRPPSLICGISAVAPFIGPIVFLCIPGIPDPTGSQTLVEQMAPPKPEEVPAQEEIVPETHGEIPVAENVSPASHHPKLKLAHEEPAPAAPVLPAPIVFRRGEFSFNRRFFETKMPGFFRVVPGEAEKDMVLVVKAARGEFTGKRITNVTQNELFLQVFKEEATHDEMIPFNEIQEVRIRHKDAT